MPITIVLIIYGGFLLLGGVMGFKTAGSKSSLIAGLVLGSILIVAGALVERGITAGAWLGFGVNLLAIVVFGMRWAKTRKVMPAGFLLGVSSIVAGILVTQLFQ